VRIPGPQPLNVAQQYHVLRNNPICPGEGHARCGSMTWKYDVHPTLLSRTYTVQINYRVGKQPQILIRRPDLIELAGDRRLPHVYQQNPPLLCVYRPTKGEWTSRMRLDQTIVPWTSLWLFYFEEWLASNEWKGGGEHPGDTDKPLPYIEGESR
jgi:hypothetical protein